MRIVYDYGMRPVIPVQPPHPGTQDTHTEPVMIVRSAPEAKDQRDPGLMKGSEGVPIPGTDYLMKTSDAAAARDSEVRAHEKAHLMNLGSAAASGIQLVTQRGPDGESYAVGGGVKVDMSPVPGDPRGTLSKAHSILRAALAPGNPSAADMRVAAEAYRMVRDAKTQLLGEGLLI